MSDSAALSCPHCQIGYLQPDQTTYSGVHHGMVISMPNMPSWTCDICQHHEFDETAIGQLEALVGQLSLPTEVAQRSAKRTPVENDVPAAQRLKP